MLGSAGSNRIRSALLQTIVGVVDRGLRRREAVDAPRVHFENGVVYHEPGIDLRRAAGSASRGESRRLRAPNLFFGGVQAVHSARWAARAAPATRVAAGVAVQA